MLAYIAWLSNRRHRKSRYTGPRTGTTLRSVFEIQVEMAQMYSQADSGVVITMVVDMAMMICPQYRYGVNMLVLMMFVMMVSMPAMATMVVPFASSTLFYPVAFM